MHDDLIAPEQLAAFLDGTLDEKQRREVVEWLARSGASYDAFIEARAVLLMLASDPSGAVQPEPRPLEGRSRISTCRWRVAAFAIPALAAAIVAVFVLQRGTAQPSALVVIESLIPSVAASPGIALAGDVARWPATRGVAAFEATPATALRFGAGVADLELAFEMRDTVRLVAVGAELATLAGGLKTGTPAAQRVMYAIRDGGTRTTSMQRRAVATELRTLSASPLWFDAGIWSETARRAGYAGDSSFFSNATALGELSRLIAGLDRESERDSAAGQLVGRLRSLERRNQSGRSLAAFTATLDSLIAEGGR